MIATAPAIVSPVADCSDTTARRAVHRTGAAVLAMAVAVLVISAAYAAGRAGSRGPGWVAAYWAGEGLLFAPVAWRLLSRHQPAETEAAGLVLCAATATYLVKVCYSPAAFGFPDELEHWRTTVNLLTSHHLYGVNYVLPVSPVYPGLEEATGALASVTGLPVFTAGLIVAGFAHLLFTATLYVVFRLVGGSARLAGTACVIYLVNPHYQVFDAIYGYQTLALAFLGLTLVAALGASRTDRVRWWLLAVVFTGATVVTHHVSSYVLAAMLVLVALAGAARSAARRRLPDGVPVVAAILACACVGLIVAWASLVATNTVTYLTPTLHSFADGLSGIFTAHPASGSSTTPSGPLADQLAGYAATGLIMTGLPFGWWQIWRTQRDRTWALALGTGAAAYYVLALLRITTPDGAELAGRGMTFVYIPVAYTLAMAVRGWRPALRAPAVAHVCGACAAFGILLAGGITSGWPPYWERLPGGYVVDGFESGITPEGIAAAAWAGAELGSGQRIAADFTNYLLLGSYGDQDPVGNLDSLYCGPDWTDLDAGLAGRQSVRYLLVDLRMSEYKSVTGGYFADASSICPSPIPRQDLAKFGTVPGFERIYDSGNIVIYSLPGGQNAP
jgi:hypothetical protein